MIKINEYVRYQRKGKSYIGKILQECRSAEEGELLGVTIGYNYIPLMSILGNSKPIPVELLEVNDVVHGKMEDMQGNKLVINDFEITIKTTQGLDELKRAVNEWGGLTITAVELHENRVVQRLEGENVKDCNNNT